MKLVFELNGQPIEIDTPAERRAVDLLREDLGLTGTKECCGTGECGACTVLVDGEAWLSCLTLAGQLDGKRVLTVEGMTTTPVGEQVQRAFVEHGAVQCGFCTPGMELAAVALIERDDAPSREAIREGLSGNLCRCTGYVKIIDAVEVAAAAVRAGREAG